MGNCTYTEKKGKGAQYKSYLEFAEHLSTSGIIGDSISDIIYSAIIPLDEGLALARTIQSKFIANNVSRASKDFADIDPKYGDMSILDFYNSPLFVNSSNNGKLVLTAFNKLDYKKLLVELFSKLMSREDAENKVLELEGNQETIGNDGFILHNVLNLDTSNKINILSNINKEYLKANKENKIPISASSDLYNTLHLVMITLVLVGPYSGCRIIKNIGIDYKLDNGTVITGHIDNLVIDKEGTPHIVNYKVTTMDPSLWAAVKYEGYKYLLVFLKKMLQHYGFDTTKTSLSLIPIRVNYGKDLNGDTDYSKILSIVALDVKLFAFRDNKYLLTKEDEVVNKFINNSITARVTPENLLSSLKLIDAAFPTFGILTDGVRKSALSWIKKYSNSPLIQRVNSEKGVWSIKFNGEDEAWYTDNPNTPENNEDIIKHVTEKLKTVNDSIPVAVGRLATAIRNAQSPKKDGSLGVLDLDPLFLYNSSDYFYTMLSKYMEIDESKSEEELKWELLNIEDLLDSNILLFRNKITNVVDVISLSAFDLTLKEIRKDNTNILGYYIPDYKSGELINHKCDYGNIEIFRTMAVLNSVIPNIKGNFSLGLIAVLSSALAGLGRAYNIGEYSKLYWKQMLQVIQNNNPNLKIKNNLEDKVFENPISTLLSEYRVIFDQCNKNTLLLLTDIDFSLVLKANNMEAKRKAIHELLQRMLDSSTLSDIGRISHYSLERLMELAKNSDLGSERSKLARLYLTLLNSAKLLDNLFINPGEETISTLYNNYMSTPDTNPSLNFRVVYNIFNSTINDIAYEYNKHLPLLTAICENFYNNSGYSKLQNSIIGNLTALFLDMINMEDMTLKNPYTDTTLTSALATFIKNFIFQLGKIRFANRKITWNFTGIEDPKFKLAIDLYDFLLWVPLKRVSKESLRNSALLWTKDKVTKIKLMFSELGRRKLGERVLGLDDYTYNDRDKDIDLEKLQIRNPFLETSEIRSNMLESHDVGYFETNLESLMKDFIERDIATNKLLNMLVEVKCFMYGLEAMKYTTNNKAISEVLDTIHNFLKTNVYDSSLMEVTSLKILGILNPLRKVAGHFNIGFSVIGAFRDVMLGLWENTARACNKYQINISAKSLAKAYKTVLEGSASNCRTINIINLLNLIYRISNIDIARIAEGSKTGRGGLINFENIEYSTLRRPDFLNRMVLFVGKMIEDGVYDSLSIKDGALVYDWKKDLRFSIYASGDKTNPKYLESRGRYFSAIKLWNEENPDNLLEYSDNLPLPYLSSEATTIKTVANGIYGAYDKSTKSFYEHLAGGFLFGTYTTWMNGIINNWFLKPGIYLNRNMQLIQETDINNNKLYLDELGNIITEIDGKYINLDTNIEYTKENLSPIYKYVPLMVLGIVFTITDMLKSIGNMEEFKRICNDPMQLANIKKLISDMVAIMMILFIGGAVKSGYKDYKKNTDPGNLLKNTLVELGAKSFIHSTDVFYGPGNAIDFLHLGMTPLVVSFPYHTVLQLTGLFGGRLDTFLALTKSAAPFRVMADSYRIYESSQKKLE